MMKRFIAVILMAVMLVGMCTTASAEEFRLHKGVRFGMTAEEIIAQEALSGNTFRVGVPTRVYNESQISILSAEDVKVRFTLDDEGKLYQQQYVFSTYQFDHEVTYGVVGFCNAGLGGHKEFGMFRALGEEYEKVYGRPNCSSVAGGKLVLPANMCFQTTLFTSSTIASDISGYILGKGEAAVYEITGQLSYPKSDVNYYQWLVETDGGYVVIEVYGYEYYSQFVGQSKTWIGADYAVDYRYFTEAEYAALWNSYESDI